MRWPHVNTTWLLFGAALVLRVGWVVYRWNSPGPAPYPDEDLHWQLATHLVRDGTLISDDGRYAARMPLYPLFLALFAGLGSVGILVAKLAQAAVGAATAVVGYRLAESALGRRAGLVVGVLIACDPFAVFFANLLLSEVMFTLLALGLTACAWSLLTAPANRAALLRLAMLGPAIILTRPSAVLWIPLVWVLLAGLAVARGRAGAEAGQDVRAWRALSVRLLICPAALIVLMLPWGLRNHAVLGSYAWLSTNGGVTLYDAQGPEADGSSNQAFLRETPEFQGLGEVALDHTLKHRALEQMWSHPRRALRLAGVKFLRMWSPRPNVAEHRSGPEAYAGAAYTLFLLLAAAAGLMRTRAGDRQVAWFQALVWLPLVYFTILHCVYIGSVRYRVPLMPFLALAAGSAWKRPISQTDLNNRSG